MDTLNKAQEAALVECLQALEVGARIDDCLARFPEDAAALRPHLELRSHLLSMGPLQAPAPAYAAGRRALLERLAVAAPTARFWTGWLRAPLARAAVTSVLLFALAGGALGASAAAGVDRAHDVLSALHIVAPASQSDQQANPNAGEGGSNRSDGIGNAPTAADTGRGHANDNASNGSDNGVGEDHRPCKPTAALGEVPALQERFTPCATAESGAATGTPTPRQDESEHGQPTDTGSDHRPATPPRPTTTPSESGEHGRPTSVPPPHPTPHNNSDNGDSEN